MGWSGIFRAIQGQMGMAVERRRVVFAGAVQGVGFRMTTRRLALARPVAGFVRNQPDGRVELLVEGESSALDDLVAAIRREFAAGIATADTVLEAPGDPPLEGFAIH